MLRVDSFLRQLWPNFVYVCQTVEQAITALKSVRFDAIFLDHDLKISHYQIYHDCVENSNTSVARIDKFDNETGYAVAKFLAENLMISPFAHIYIHSQNSFQAKRMKQVLRDKRPCVLVPYNRPSLFTGVFQHLCGTEFDRNKS